MTIPIRRRTPIERAAYLDAQLAAGADPELVEIARTVIQAGDPAPNTPDTDPHGTAEDHR